MSKMKTIKIKGYEIHSSPTSDLESLDYKITKNNKLIANLKYNQGHYNAYIFDAEGSINYEKKPEKFKSFKLLSFLTQVIDDIEIYYTRKKCFF